MRKKNKKNNDIIEIDNENKEDRIIEDDEDEEQKVEEQKPKKEKKVKKAFNLYKFIFKIVACALLITLGIFVWVKKEESVGIIYMASGIIIAGFALIRLIPLFKTLENKKSKIVSICEIGLHIVLGVYLIICACIKWNIISAEKANETVSQGLINFDNFNLAAFSYIIVIVLWSRALCHFWLVDLYHEATNKINFWFHATFMTLAVVLGCLAHKVTPNTIVIILIVMCFSSAVVIGGEAAGGYIIYRRSLVSKEEKKEKKKDKGKELPANKEEEINDIDPNIIPKNDNDQDSAIVS